MDLKTVRPLGDRVIVEREKPPEKIGLIHIPDSAQEKTQRGKVLAVGPGRLTESGMRIEPVVKKGDRVIFGRYAGDGVGGVWDRSTADQLVLREDDILGIDE